MNYHEPVLLKEVIQYLNPQSNQNFIDCTIGGGGHAKSILEKTSPSGKLLGIDLDPQASEASRENLKDFQNRITIVCDNFRNLKNIVERYNFENIDGILFDLGFSSYQIEQSGRGLSFMRDEPLDMRFDPEGHITAAMILNKWPEGNIEKILREYGEERYARRIARKIILQRERNPFSTTSMLVRVVLSGYENRRLRIHPATKTFQALRIVVNDELSNLREALPQALEVLSPSGKIAVISFHSLEDRIVKNFFKERRGETLNILTKKPIMPLQDEVIKNPRSRSAKLRAAQKIK